MAKTREIKKRMTAVGTIQRITKTMQMIATAKFTAAVGRTKATQPYAEKIRQLVGEVAIAAGDDVEHPLLSPPSDPVRRELVLVIASDRGLCGAYNANILRAAITHLRKLRSEGIEFDLETAGKKAIGFFRFQKQPIDQRHTIGDKPKYEEVERIAARYIEEFTAGKYDAVRVAYMQFISNARQKPVVMQLLPLKSEEVAGDTGGESAGAAPSASYDFSPSSHELLDELLPMAVKTTLFQAFNEAVVSEQIMRMVAMKAATENAKDLGKSLRRDFNRARQTQITTELSEIIAGAAALD